MPLPLVRSWFHDLVVKRATDVTADTSSRTALIVAPHPDDETLGCGVTILRKRDLGTPVTLLVVTDGRHSHTSAAISPEALAALRERELRKAASRLGLADDAVEWLGIEDGTVSAAEDRLTARLVELLRRFRPDELYATCAEESHPDHAAVGRAARRAVAQVPGATLLEYPIWLWDTWPLQRGRRVTSAFAAFARALPGRTWAVGTDPLVDRKLFALGAHASQLGRPDGVPSSQEWAGLPDPVLAEASGPVEVFFRTRPSAR